MDSNRFISLLPKTEVIATSTDSVYVAQQQLTGCEACDTGAKRLFSSVLDEVTNRTEGLTDYILCEPLKCFRCDSPILESTRVSTAKADSTPAFELDTPLEELNLFLVEEPLILEAQEWIGTCEHCSDLAEFSFDQILDSLTGSDPTVTEYVLCRAAVCPCCHGEVTEKTLVSPV
jgi:hypothetical protein